MLSKTAFQMWVIVRSKTDWVGSPSSKKSKKSVSGVAIPEYVDHNKEIY